MPLLEIENLAVDFHTDEGVLRAVDGVSMSIEPGETLGIVGESGSGKSVSSLAVLGLIPQPPGKIRSGRAMFAGRDLLAMPQKELAKIRGNRIAMIFQDPMTSLNPFLTVGQQIAEVTRIHVKHTRDQAIRHAIEMLDRVGIPAPARRIDDYPHQFSGGMRQRVMIAMAVACRPRLLVADEPTTALDVTIQAGILDVLRSLRTEIGMAVLLITHDLGVVADIADRVVVMYAGRTIETAGADALFARPGHPYTRGLLDAVPNPARHADGGLREIPGRVPILASSPDACTFADRCPRADDVCRTQRPALEPGPAGHPVRCWHPLAVPA
jgi:oligopeptide/dipeptide ABC transporter ATP-binding protein